MTELRDWNSKVDHPLQAWEWGEFRKKTGVKVVREGGVQVTIHPLPYTPWTIGYCPKARMPNQEQVTTLKKIAKDNNCIMIKIEPKVERVQVADSKLKQLEKMGFVRGRSLFTKYNFVLDVTKSETELLSAMKQKTRYNIKVAVKNKVKVEIDNSKEALERYLTLTEETKNRQKFLAHNLDYHRKMWQTLYPLGMAQLLVARLGREIVTTWILFKFHDTLYYPYGASTRSHREVMANNLVMWEAIKLAKKWKCKYFDMWGALGKDPDKNDPWFGFHNFKSGYGARHVEYVGTWDYVTKPFLYRVFCVIDYLRWKILRLFK